MVRHEVHYRAPLIYDFKPVSIECWVTEIRAASFTMAYEVFHDHEDGRRVYLRATTVLTPFLFEAERPRRVSDAEREVLTAYLEDSPDWADPLRLSWESRRDDVGHYPVHVRFSDVDVYGHVNNVKYFEYFMEARILFTARLWKGLAEEGMPARMVDRADGRRLQAADPVPPGAVRRMVLVDSTWATARWSSPRRSSTGTGCSRGPAWRWCSWTRRPARRRLRRTRSGRGCSPLLASRS